MLSNCTIAEQSLAALSCRPKEASAHALLTAYIFCSVLREISSFETTSYNYLTSTYPGIPVLAELLSGPVPAAFSVIQKLLFAVAYRCQAIPGADR